MNGYICKNCRKLTFGICPICLQGEDEQYPKTCLFNECEETTVGKGLCKKHYMKEYNARRRKK